jgi:hypothetical protein
MEEPLSKQQLSGLSKEQIQRIEQAGADAEERAKKVAAAKAAETVRGGAREYVDNEIQKWREKFGREPSVNQKIEWRRQARIDAIPMTIPQADWDAEAQAFVASEKQAAMNAAFRGLPAEMERQAEAAEHTAKAEAFHSWVIEYQKAHNGHKPATHIALQKRKEMGLI